MSAVVAVSHVGEDADPFDKVIGTRRPLGIGITSQEYRQEALGLPSAQEISRYSANPRNAYGDWYEEIVRRELADIVAKHGWSFRPRVGIGFSKVYQTSKFVDIVVNDRLGLELKFLKGTGSLVQPKAMVDALDFTNRPLHCIYMVDGPGWLRGAEGRVNIDYLAKWWEFTCFRRLEDTLIRFFDGEFSE